MSMAQCCDDGEAMACGRRRRPLGASILCVVKRCFRRFSARDELAGLSERELRDIGAERRDIAAAVDRANTKLHVRDFRARG